MVVTPAFSVVARLTLAETNGHGREAMHPTVDYTKSGRYSIAYQVTGEGPPDVVFIPEWFNILETQWDDPRFARFPAQLASFARLIMLNQRGMGLSDPISIDDSMTARRLDR